MRALIEHNLHQLVDAAMAPFYFHLGHIAMLDEFAVLAHDLVDILASYYVFFIFLIAAFFFRNYILSFLTNHVFKQYNLDSFKLPLNTALTSFWIFLKTFFSKK